MLRSLAGGAVFGELWGDGPVRVVALHGWMRTHADFSRSLGPDAPDGPLAVLAPDLPGFGASPVPPEAWGSAEYAAAVAGLLQSTGGATGPSGPVVVVGHSFGGRVALRLAASRPELVHSLVLSGVPGLAPRSGRSRSPVGYRAVRALRRVGVVSEARLERARHRYGSEDYRRSEGVMRAVLVRAVNERYDEDVAALRCPVELVWGDDDDAAPLEGAQAVVAKVPGSVLTVCPGAGHLTPLTAPAALRAAVERCLARH